METGTENLHNNPLVYCMQNKKSKWRKYSIIGFRSYAYSTLMHVYNVHFLNAEKCLDYIPLMLSED